MQTCDQALVGNSYSIKRLQQLIHQVANSDLNVIICGESGVGKELVAQELHSSSNRRDKPFVKVNCAAIPHELLESELFGYERGAFTGADKSKKGKFELAHKGTILLDEIGDMPLRLQSKMLQVLQDFKFSRLGAKNDVKIDCWVLAATNHDLERDIREGLFREDLYYRLNIINIYVPPLRERPEDIDLLIDHFSERFVNGIERSLFEFNEDARNTLRQYFWPGNIRELKNTVERLMLLGDWPAECKRLLARETRWVNTHELATNQLRIAPETGSPNQSQKANKFPPLKEVKRKAVQYAESRLIRKVLRETAWNRTQAADILEISYKALLYKIKDLNLRPGE